MIGYKNIPVTGITQRGPMSVMVGLTYVRVDDTIEIWDSWMNPVIEGQLDMVDRTWFLSMATTKLSRNLPPMVEREWKGVVYG